MSANALIVFQHWTDWSSLKFLDIASPQLDAAAVHVLCVKWRMPELQCLELGLSNHFTKEVMCELLKGANQADVVLKPGNNVIQNPADVACGRWPHLHTIHFDYVEHDSHCFQHCKRDYSIERFLYGQPVMSAVSRYRYSCWESYISPS